MEPAAASANGPIAYPPFDRVSPGLSPMRVAVQGGRMIAPTLDNAAHVVQLALTPIFLLTGLASLLNVFTTRLGRVADRVDRLTQDSGVHKVQLHRLRMRSHALDLAVLLAALAGGLTCCAALTLFLGALRNAAAATVLFAVFGAAILCAILSLASFSFEMILSGRSVREQAETGSTEDVPEK